MKKPLVATIATAFLASLLFLAIAGSGLGFLFIFLPCIPFFLLGFAFSPRLILQAGLISSLLISILTGNLIASILFFMAFAIPCWFSSRLLSWHYDIKLGDNQPILRLWYPVGLVILDLAVYACAVLAIATAFYATQEINLPQLLAADIKEQINLMQKQYDMAIDIVPQSLSFMLCGFFAWLWVIAVWAHAWIANYALNKQKITNRPSLAIHPFPIPNWLLTLMSICALASLIGGESMRFLGKSSLIILLLPYFFQGAALLNLSTQKWVNQRFFLFFVYFSIATLFWPAFILSGIGLFNHIKILNKHLSSGGNSPIS